MALTFDTLGYAKRLQEGGVGDKQAEAHTEAARDFIMVELVTKSDLRAALDTQTLRLGGIVVATVGAAVAIMGFLIRFH
ncbi:hypothetical protein [Tardiphaga sp.]|uniref:hypothetical protein n=1 Tax=Tardiphaga sp. TaxID=1926292 RepID=UPI0037D9B7A7